MIEQVSRMLAEGVPSRLLDTLLHEVVTGQIDEQKDDPTKNWSRETARAHGDILVDLGAERLRIRVPFYTSVFDDAIKLLPKDQSWALSYIPAGHKSLGKNTCDAFAMVIRNERLDPSLVSGGEKNIAMIACRVAIDWCRRPK